MKIIILGPIRQRIFKSYRIETLINFLKNDGNTVLHYNKKLSLNFLKKKKIEFIISNGYSFKLDKKIIETYKKKAINLHNAYLPYGRGIGVNLFCLIKNLPTGISIHYMDENWDTGDIIYRKLIRPKYKETYRNFYLRLLYETNQIFMKKWQLIKNSKIKAIKQTKQKIDTTSRLRTEYLLEYFGNSYDLKIKDINTFKKIFLKNEMFIKNLNGS